jgi:membrane fusion protein (multidrug efflux system)
MGKMEAKRTLIWLGLSATALLAAGCGDQKPETVAAAPAAATSSASLPAAQPKAEDTLTVTGPLIVEHQVDVMAQRDGIVTSTSYEPGARVKAGTVLARLDDRQLSANLEAARAKSRSIVADLKNWQSEAEVLKADYARQKRLWDLGLTSEEQLEHAKYKAESDQWDIQRVQETLNTAHEEERSLDLELEKTKITAPFDGLVARRYVRVGQSVAKGDRLFWVTAEAPLRMRFTLPERFVGHLQKGQELPLSSPDLPQEQHMTRVLEVSRVVDPASGTIEVLVELDGAPGGLRPGMTSQVRVSVSR